MIKYLYKELFLEQSTSEITFDVPRGYFVTGVKLASSYGHAFVTVSDSLGNILLDRILQDFLDPNSDNTEAANFFKIPQYQYSPRIKFKFERITSQYNSYIPTGILLQLTETKPPVRFCYKSLHIPIIPYGGTFFSDSLDFNNHRPFYLNAISANGSYTKIELRTISDNLIFESAFNLIGNRSDLNFEKYFLLPDEIREQNEIKVNISLTREFKSSSPDYIAYRNFLFVCIDEFEEAENLC